MQPSKSRVLGKLWREFLPLSMSDVMMAFGDPLVSGTLSHLPDARLNLAAVGAMKPIAIFFESPVIMFLHASNLLAEDKKSLRALWRFLLLCLGSLTAFLAILSVPFIFEIFGRTVLGLDGELLERGRWVLLLMALWPASSGWRRYFQGILIRGGFHGDVAFASIGRFFVGVLILALGFFGQFPGYLVGASALAGTIFFEAVFVTAMAYRRKIIKLDDTASSSSSLPSTIGGVAKFYFPLANTMLVVWGSRALLIAMVARSVDKSIALAAWPAAWGLVLLVANSTRMVQQVIIRNRKEISESMLAFFATTVGAVGTFFLVGMAASPFGNSLLSFFVGNDPELLKAVEPVVLLCGAVPLLVAIQNAFQGFLISEGRTYWVNYSSWLGAGVLLGTATLLVSNNVAGATAAGSAMLASLTVETIFLSLGLTKEKGGYYEIHPKLVIRRLGGAIIRKAVAR